MYIFLLSCAFNEKTYSFRTQNALRVRLVRILKLRGLVNVEEVVAPAKQSEVPVEEAEREKPLMQLQMNIDFDETRIVFTYL